MHRLLIIVPALIFPALVNAMAETRNMTDEEMRLLVETRHGVSEIPIKLMETLQHEIGKGDFASAINACKEKAPKMAQIASMKTGWDIRRVSEKNRNPAAVPDDWEAQALHEFAERARQGEALSGLEKGEIISRNGERSYRYIKALPTQPLCLACHGESGQISAEVKTALDKLYPGDKATGYGLNQIRGGLTVIRPLETPTPARR